LHKANLAGVAVAELRGKDRLIVALDVPTSEEALQLVEKLDNVSFLKVGWQLFISGNLPWLLGQLKGKNVFVDLKVPGDIGNTIRSVVELCVAMNVKFLTLSESVLPPTIAAALNARGDKPDPKLLTVPYLSNMDEADLQASATSTSLEDYIRGRAVAAIAAGCDGVIASGQAIKVCRQEFGDAIIIVSPGIRPTGASADDHKRHTTPAGAIRLGADYLVVGRPIRNDPNPRKAAQQIIEEIDVALDRRRTSGSSSERSAMSAKPASDGTLEL
jgi:orotidine-5'-phosphate decarboxylase